MSATAMPFGRFPSIWSIKGTRPTDNWQKKKKKLAFLEISSEIRAHHGKSCLNGELLLGLYLDHDRADCHGGA